jgi:hypothetical protein
MERIMAQQKRTAAHKGIWFSMVIRGDEYVAFVSGDALTEHFNASATAGSQMAAYRENHQQIHAAAEAKFLAGGERPIKLSADDFAFYSSDSVQAGKLAPAGFADSGKLLGLTDMPSNHGNFRRYQ